VHLYLRFSVLCCTVCYNNYNNVCNIIIALHKYFTTKKLSILIPPSERAPCYSSTRDK
jgi:hypothetical protein